jgi:hypothetical protein
MVLLTCVVSQYLPNTVQSGLGKTAEVHGCSAPHTLRLSLGMVVEAKWYEGTSNTRGHVCLAIFAHCSPINERRGVEASESFGGAGHVKRDARKARLATTHPRSRFRSYHLTSTPRNTLPTVLDPHAIMEDRTMMEASQGLFEEHSFTIIPNGLPEESLDKVRDALGHGEAFLTR